MCLKGRNIQKAMFYWNAKVTKCRYQKHFPNYLTLHYKTLFLMDDFLKICIFVNKICMAMNLWELNHTKWCKLTTSFNDLEEVCKEIKKKKRKFSWSIMFYINENSFADNFFLCFDIFSSHCFSVLSSFLSSFCFWNN